ncbi:MAG: hypothetical protein PHQ43_05720 [Dehalococcoidales bacterium]|nr:hypothetical protein [Dehalococcoidales bacterium]
MSITVTVRIAFTSNAFDASPTWVDVSSDVERISIRRGRQYYLNRIEAGTATVTLRNSHGDYWPKNAGGSYYGYVMPVKRINIRVTYNGITYDRFTGYITSWDPDFLLNGFYSPVVTLQCVELQKNMARCPIAASAYSAELSGARFGHILDSMGWPAGARSIAAGQVNIAAGPAVDTNALSHAYDVQDAELGLFFISGAGNAVFQDRLTRNSSPYDTSQATFGDSGADLRYIKPLARLDDQFIYNRVTGIRSGGSQKTANDTDRQTRDGLRCLDRGTLVLTTDNDVEDQVYFLLRRYRDASLRVQAITLLPGSDPSNLYPKVLGSDISTRITVKLTQASINEDYHIEGINDDWEARKPNSWRTTWQLSNATDLAYPERTILTLRPDGVGDLTNQVPYPSEYENWECVLEEDDGKYVASSNPRDLYTATDIVSIGPTLAVRIIMRCRRMYSGMNGTCRALIKLDGNTSEGPPHDIPGISYQYFSTTFYPGQLTVSQVNSMQIGMNLSLSECDYLYAEIETYSDW